MRDNKEYVLIEKEFWESVCSRVAVLSQKMRVYEQTHQPAPQYYNNKEVQQLLNVDDKLIRKYRDEGLLGHTKVEGKYWYNHRDEGLLGHTKVEGKYWYNQKDVADFLERNKHKSFK